jgi:anti-sigma regulatory factor (Ser/Thr protein kinase)
MAELPNVRLNLSNRPENVLLVRQVLTGVAEAIDLDGSDLNDIRTAVTEACNNVVLHAYEGEEGPLEIEVYIAPSALGVVVRDQGTGIQPRALGAEETTLGIGLPVIQALAHRVEFADAAVAPSRAGWAGTEVRMEFPTPSTRALESLHEGGLELLNIAQAEPTTTMGIAIAPTRLARAVLPRLLSALAARAHFSTDRISDAQLVADALIAHAPESISGRHLGVGVSIEPRNLELRIGPLDAGHAQRLIVDSALEGLGAVIEKLTDHHRVATVGPSEVLALRLIDRR